MCEIRLPYMTSGDEKVLKAIQYARASVWRVAVMPKLTTDEGDTADNMHDVTKELSDSILPHKQQV